MSFPIQLYSNTSPTNKVSKDITLLSTVEGTLRNGASVIDPTIVIEATTLGNPNYLYIETFGRYYYITNIISVNYNLWELHCHVDVLMSYSAQILEQTAIVARQETKYNLMLDDGFFMAYQNPIIITKRFSNQTPFETQEFVLVVAGA